MAEKHLTCKIVTPKKTVFEGAAEMVIVPAYDGEMGVLPGHAALIASLSCGECRIISGTMRMRFYVEGGIVKVLTRGTGEDLHTEVVLLTEVSCTPEELRADRPQIAAELKEAKNLKITDDASFERRFKAIEAAGKKLKFVEKSG